MKTSKSRIFNAIKIAITVSSLAYTYSASAIVNGIEATKAESSHHLMLLVKDRQRCGASILNDYWAVTAAHCVNTFEGIVNTAADIKLVTGTSINVTAGGDSGTSGSSTHQVVRTKTYTTFPIPEGLEPLAQGKDVALLQVSTPFSNQLARVGLFPKATLDRIINGNGVKDVNVFGMGRGTATVNGIRRLEKSFEDVIPAANCAEKSVPDGFDPTSSLVNANKVFCTTGTRTQQINCEGDSGGGLIARDGQNNPVLLGVVSFGTKSRAGSGCSFDYSVFARPDNFYNDIIETIKSVPRSGGTTPPPGNTKVCPVGTVSYQGTLVAGQKLYIGGQNGNTWYETNQGAHDLQVLVGTFDSQIEKFNTDTSSWDSLGVFEGGTYSGSDIAAGFYQTSISSQTTTPYHICLSVPLK